MGGLRRSSAPGGAEQPIAGTTTTSSSAAVREEGIVWEMRPGGMLVQKRTDSEDTPQAPLIRVRVVFGSTRFEVSVNSQSTFGELKKRLTAECGLEHWEQRVEFRGKERGDKDFLDISGVKDRSKVVLMEDPCSREKRMIEMRRIAKFERAQRAVTDVSVEVDQLAAQVVSIEKSISKGIKVPEIQITTMIEMLMGQAVKLNAISTQGDISALKNFQGKRVQKCVETLDVMKMANAKLKPVIVTTKWETFDPPTPPTPQWNLLD